MKQITQNSTKREAYEIMTKPLTVLEDRMTEQILAESQKKRIKKIEARQYVYR